MLLVLIAGALAGPARCVATWTGPATEGCGVRGEVKATAAGASEKAAEKATRRELAESVDLAVAGQRARIPSMSEAEFARCQAVVRDEAYVNCFADASLAEDTLCFVELADPECWNGQVQQITGVGWQVFATGRDAMCRAVDERLVQLNWTELPTRRAVCAASCASKTTVRCVGGK